MTCHMSTGVNIFFKNLKSFLKIMTSCDIIHVMTTVKIFLSHPPNEVWNEEGGTGSLRTSMRGQSQGTKWLRLFWIKQLRCTGHTHTLSLALSLSLSLSLSRCAWLSLQNQSTHFRTGFDLRKQIQPLWLLLLRSSCYLPAVHVLFDFSWKKSCHVVADPLISHFPPGGKKLFFVEIFFSVSFSISFSKISCT